jgi:hypothetical protein
VCWAFLPNEKQATIARVMPAFQTAVVELDPEFTCSALVIDNCAAEQQGNGSCFCTSAIYSTFWNALLPCFIISKI